MLIRNLRIISRNEKRSILPKIIPALFLIICNVQLLAQVKPDSLWTVWQDVRQADSTRLNSLNQYASDVYLNTQPDSAFTLAQIGFDFAKEKGLKNYMGLFTNTQAYSFRVKGEYPRAIEYYNKSLTLFKETGNKKEVANALNHIGYNYYFQSDYAQAIDYYERSMLISEEIGDHIIIAFTLRRIGQVYFVQTDFENTQVYWQKALEVSKEFDDKKGYAQVLNNLGAMNYRQSEYVKALNYYERSLEIRYEIGDNRLIAMSLNNIGVIYGRRGNYLKALDYLERSLKIKEEAGEKYQIAESLIEIGGIHLNNGNYVIASEYYQKCLALYKEIGIKNGIASSLHNIGICQEAMGNNELALSYQQQSLVVYKEIGDKGGISAVLSSIGSIYYAQLDYTKAMEYYQSSYQYSKEIGDKASIAGSYIGFSYIYSHQKNFPKLISASEKAYAIAKEIGAINIQRTASEYLYIGYKELGENDKALKYHEQMLSLADSLQSEETAKKLQQMEFEKQVLLDSIATAEKERLVQIAHNKEILEKEKTRNIGFVLGGFFLILAGGFYTRWRYVKKSKDIIEKEKDRSDQLLLNILPSEIAEELKIKGKAEARKFNLVSILFTDFVSFTEISEKLSAAELVKEINTCFEAFDHIMEKYKIEKIKTIGDAYMAAGGLPITTDDSIKNTVLAALEMQTYISKRKAENDTKIEAFEMRVGIHCGPVVAGIVGVKKFQYDIWGDTVNTASRMESNGEAGKVNISQAVYELLIDDPDFSFESRGNIETKGKGKIKMYFVSKN